jgi:hypothetical protein
MLGSDSGIISLLPSLPKPNASTLAKKKQQTKNFDNRALKFFECILSAYSPAQLTSNDPKQHTVSLLQIKTSSNIKCITNISNHGVEDSLGAFA